MKKEQESAGRILPEEVETGLDQLLYMRHLFAYHLAKEKISKNDIVLDLGCGEGYGSNILAKKANQVIGLDISNNIIEKASEKYGNEKLSFKVYDGTKFPFDNEKFDFITSFQVIEHIENDEYFVSEIYRILKKKGTLLLVTPNRNYRLWSWQKPWNPFHIREYNLIQLKNILIKKFEKVEILGIEGREDVRKKINKSVRIHKIDPFKFRRFLPRSLRNKVSNSLNNKFINVKNSKVFEKAMGYFFVSSNCEKSLDFLAICRKY